MNASRLSGWYVSAAVTDLEACGRYSGDVFFNRWLTLSGKKQTSFTPMLRSVHLGLVFIIVAWG